MERHASSVTRGRTDAVNRPSVKLAGEPGAGVAHQRAVAQAAEETVTSFRRKGKVNAHGTPFRATDWAGRGAAVIWADPAFLSCGVRWWGGRDGVVAETVFEKVEGPLGAVARGVLCRCRGLRSLSA